MKEKGNVWIAKTAVIGYFAVLLLQLITGSESAWSAVRAGLYFGVIFAGYRWGIPGGAVGGVLCGLAELVRSGELAALGSLCVMGVLAGCFPRLGKGAVVLAYLCGAFGVGFLWAEEYLYRSIPELLLAGALFLLMPMKPSHKGEERSAASADWGRLQRQKLRETADSYGKLARICDNFYETEATDEGNCEEEWKHRFLESREAVGQQFRQIEQALKEMAVQLDQAVDVTECYEDRIKARLHSQRLRMKHLLVIEDGDQRRDVYVTVSSSRGGCVTAREVGESIGKVLDRSLRPADGGRVVVGKDPCTIRLVEDTKYRLLSGVARECKKEEELSGDNFSCHDLPGGKTMLCLSDGMGSGRQAFLESQLAMEMLEELLDAGFMPERAIYMVNSLLVVQEEQNPTTLDLAWIDLYTGHARFYKQGAVGTFVRRGHQVLQIQPGALPMGVECAAAPACAQLRLEHGDMIVMVTDGILDALEGEDKEAVFCEYLAGTTKNNARELADEILQMARETQTDGALDDRTVLTAGIWKK